MSAIPASACCGALRDAIENGLPRADRDRGAQPCRPWPTPMRRAPPACPARCSAAIGRRPADGQSEHQDGHLPVHRRGAGGGSGASGPTSPSSTRRRPTAKGDVLVEGIIGVQKEAVLAAKRAVVTVEEVVDDFDDLHPNLCVLPHWTIDGDRRRAGRRAPVLRAWLLRARQCRLSRMGRDRRRPREVRRRGCRTNVHRDERRRFRGRVDV